jgi:hypothetical protein
MDHDLYYNRNIKICERWNSYENFLEDMGERPENKTLDRIDNNKGYSKENCRWATPREQTLNRRCALQITFRNQTKLLADWCQELNLPYATVYTRLYAYKWSIEEALSRPVTQNGRWKK